jgi:hypothetical protein
MMVYPNPASDDAQVTFQLKAPTAASIVIRNLEGKVIQEIFNENNAAAGVYTAQLSLQQYASGIYLVELNTGKESKVVKLIIP